MKPKPLTKKCRDLVVDEKDGKDFEYFAYRADDVRSAVEWLKQEIDNMNTGGKFYTIPIKRKIDEAFKGVR